MKVFRLIGLLPIIACGDSEKEEPNTEPVITSLLIEPDSEITTSTELLCVVNAEDDDNDPLSIVYQWTSSDGDVLSDIDELILSPDTVQPTDELLCTATVGDGEAEVSESTSVIIGNTIPTVSSVSISPETVLVNSLLECSFDSDDVDGEELTVSYSWTQNGTEVGADSTLQLDAVNFSDDDVMSCTVTVEDGYEGTASDSAEVVIENTAPVIGSTTITPETPYSYDTLTCTANDVTDLELDEVTISYEWSIDGEIQMETSNMLTGPFLVGALIACRTTPNDGKIDGDGTEDSATINNTAPTLDTISISPMVNIEADTLMTCEATASDVDNEELTITYEWTQSDGTVLGSDSELQLDATMVSPGDSIACTATVTDPHGATDSQGGTVSVVNTDPVVDSAAEITGTATTTSTLTCTSSFSDLNDGTLSPTYSWTNQSGTELSTTDTYTIAAAETETGDELTCTASVEDADGATLSSSASVTIENTLPTLTGVTLSPDPVLSTDSLTCSVSSTADIDEDTVTVLYEWSVDGVVQSETSDMLSGPLLVGTLISCTTTPNDGKDDGTSDTASITVDNTAPVVDTVSLDAGPIYTDGTVTATVTLSDVDAEQTVTANYAWHVIDASNGGTDNELQTGTDSTLDGSLFDKDDQVYVIVTPNDGVEDGNFVISTPLTISNSEPTGITASVTSSDSFYNDSTLTCAATASDIDPEDSALTYTYLWSTSDAGADLVLDGTMMPGSEVTCTATVTDGSGASISADAMETLMNRAPTVDSVTLPQDVTTETTSIFCDATGSDLDGETPNLTYAWTIGGVPNAEVSDTLTDVFSYNEVVECTVTSADVTETGSSMTASTTVLNTPPVVDSVSLSPSTVYTNDVITATSVLSDVDGSQSGTLTANYEWFVDGSSVQNGSSDTLDGTTMFDRDQSVYVEVTANDSVEDGASVQSSSIVVSNTAPVMTSVTVTPDPATAGSDDLTCDAVATDADGDAILYTYEWSDSNGVQQTMIDVSDTSDVFLADGLEEDTWSCAVTPYDSTDYGSGMSASVTVESECSSLEFDGSNDYVDFGQGSTVDLFNNSDVSIELWVKPDDVNRTQNILRQGDAEASGLNRFYGVKITSTDKIGYRIRGNGGDSNTVWVEGDVNYDQWNHVVVTRDFGSTISLYLDGVLVDSASDSIGSFTLPNRELLLGISLYDGNQNPFSGEVASFNAWSQVLTGSDVEDLYLSVLDTQTIGDEIVRSDFTAATTNLEDNGQYSLTGTMYGPTWGDTCPEEDLDGDGVAAWEDCDDNDANIYPFAGDTYGDGVDSDCDDLDCEAGWDNNIYFTACPDQVNYSTASSECSNAGYGLASIQSQTEQDFAFDLMSTAGIVSTHSLWIGYSDSVSEGIWVWEDGTSAGFESWLPLVFSSNASSEDCAIMNGEVNGVRETGEWNALPCTQSSDTGAGLSHGYLCRQDFNDVDGDGVAAWEDCDDTDPAVAAYDGGTAICAAASCKAILDDGYSVGDGTYWIDPDSSGAFEVYCDMTTDSGGWSLLLSVDGSSPYWSLNSSAWTSNGINSGNTNVPTTLIGFSDDYHGLAYSTLSHDKLRVCLGDTSHCYVMEHSLDRTLQSFFVDDVSYVEYSYNADIYGNIGSISSLNNYINQLGVTYTLNSRCSWLGINEWQLGSSGSTRIGLIEDGNTACADFHHGTDPRFNDNGIGIGSWFDPSRPGVTGNAGQAWNSQSLGDLGPWFVFGK